MRVRFRALRLGLSSLCVGASIELADKTPLSKVWRRGIQPRARPAPYQAGSSACASLLSACAGRRLSLNMGGFDVISKTRNPARERTSRWRSKGMSPRGSHSRSRIRIPPEPAPVPKAHARVYHVGSMRFSVKEAPLRDSPRGELVHGTRTS